MGFRTGSYATVWEARTDPNGRVSARISIDRKNQDGNYVNDWSGWVSLYGSAKDLAGITSRTRIKLGDVDVSNSYNKENGTTQTFYKMFSYESQETGYATNANVPTKQVAVTDDPNEMPF